MTKKPQKQSNKNFICLYTGWTPLIQKVRFPSVLCISICSKITKKKSFNLNQIFVAGRPIQETQFKRKKRGCRTSGFFAMHCLLNLPMAGSSFSCECARFLKKIVPFLQQIYKQFQLFSLPQPNYNSKKNIAIISRANYL